MKFLPGKRALVFLAVAAVMLLPLAANATTYGFSQITSNGGQATESQYLVDVTAVGSGVQFHFTNSSLVASSITDIYFDDGSLLGISSINDSGAGVAFDDPAIPSNLPGANLASPPFVTTAGFSADSDNPPVANGVNTAAEFVNILFSLQGTQTFADVINELNSGDLRIGLHVQGITPIHWWESSKSESFVNNPVPIPPSVLLMGSGLLGLGLVGWRRREKKA